MSSIRFLMLFAVMFVACNGGPPKHHRALGEVSWTDGPIEGFPNAWRFEVELPSDVETLVQCTRVHDPLEVHTKSGESAVVQDILVFGLLADTDYDCVLQAGDDQQFSFMRTALRELMNTLR